MTKVDEIYDKLSKKTQVSMSLRRSPEGEELNIYVSQANGVRAEMDTGTLLVQLPKGPLSFKKDVNGNLEIGVDKDDVVKLENWELHSVDTKGNDVIVQLRTKKNS